MPRNERASGISVSAAERAPALSISPAIPRILPEAGTAYRFLVALKQIPSAADSEQEDDQYRRGRHVPDEKPPGVKERIADHGQLVP
ncbi:MAG: hypothetical protein OXF98_09125, partial [Rhodospirillaceae bacterium]|nr:hypothetical protein [Rhodospirillaceae bacterium]